MTEPLALDGYRRLVALDEPFGAVAGDDRSTDELLALALEFLDHEAGAGQDLAAIPEPRRRLRARLTVRPPSPLPPAVESAIDGVLARERAARPVVAPESLARFELAGPRLGAELALYLGDVTALSVDAIVNAANARLLGCFAPFHACIDNAIHDAAGPRLRWDCERIVEAQGSLEPTGCAKVTRAYHLPSRFVLHTVGPIVRGPLTPQHERALAAAYRACLDLAVETGRIRSLAFCAISTGVFGFPAGPAARIALTTVRDYLSAHPGALDLVVFDVFSERDRAVYERAIEEFRR